MFTKKEASRIFPYIFIDQKTKCWNWTRTLYQGYGKVSFRGKSYPTHRLLYLWKFHELPEYNYKTTFVIDHICNNRACCNPDHLRIINNKENVLNGNGITAQNARKTLCKRGHELSPRRGKDKGRKCLSCAKSPHSKKVKQKYDRKYRQRNKEKLNIQKREYYRKTHGLASSQD